MSKASLLGSILTQDEAALLNEWTREQLANRSRRDIAQLSEAELRESSAELLRHLRDAVASGYDIFSPGWSAARVMVADLSRARARQGFTPTETASFIFSLKRPLLERLRAAHGAAGQELFDDVTAASALLDRLGLYRPR
jgi:rsbT co-antagonist protein RsbR